MNLTDYYIEFMQDIYAESDAQSNFNETIFTERMCDFLVEQAVIVNYTYAGYRNSPRGIRIDAWDYDEDAEVMNLFVTDFRPSSDLVALSKSEVMKNLKRAEKFFTESLNINFILGLEESALGYELAQEIFDKSSTISRVQIFLLTNAQLSKRVGDISPGRIGNIITTYDVWDISRLFRIESSGKAREDIVIDFDGPLSEGIRCLPAFTGSNDMASYLLVMPGQLVADLYDKYGERLLEQNVRTFLQFRGNVNKGIRNTIQNEPGMFFAYNNGLTATAENVETDERQEKIKSITNLQIVNGGQTTASIFTAMKKHKADLSQVHVQVKLTIVEPEQVEQFVPKISEYANTQNKVNAADFFSNHPFHLRIEEISRRLWAPSPEGGLRETHWFYERARGQYSNAQANLSPAKQKEFLTKNPRNQMFTKTDLAKFENSFNLRPHIVSFGAQKNFAEFAKDVGQKWEQNEKQFNELYFKHLISKAIIFRFLDRNVMRQSWYGGYKANIVTYSLAKLAYIVSRAEKCLDFDAIWKNQKLTPALETELLQIAELVNEEIQKTPELVSNVTEWCKKEACWQKIQGLEISLSQELVNELIDAKEVEILAKGAQKIQAIDNGILLQKYIIDKGAQYWKEVAQYGLAGKYLSPKEMNIMGIACRIPEKIPSEKQSQVIAAIEKRIKNEGFRIEDI